jgi:zinc transport system permease protein
MLGDGLSHVGFGALAVAAIMGLAPLTVALPVVIIASFLLLRLKENGKIKGDSAIAMISAGALAIGRMIVSLSGSNTDLDGYMFGSILAITKTDFWTAMIFFPMVIIIFVLFYTQIFAVCYDENFARATGMKAGFYDMMLAVLVAITIVIGMRMMGTLLISALIIFPSVSAMRVAKSYFSTVILAVCVSVVSFLLGFFMSFAASTPIGASIVICNMISFIILYICGAAIKRK